MIKKSISLVLIISLILGALCIGAVAAEGGQITEDLAWTLDSTGRLSISGSGATMPDYSEQSPAPWAASAGKVTALSLPATLQHIGAYAFCDCAHLSEAALDKIHTIGQAAFKNCGLKTAVLPYNLKQVPGECFSGCEDLQSVVFTEIHSGVSGSLKESTEHIGARAFEFCTALESISTKLNNGESSAALPSTLQTIGDYAFSECALLQSISFADSGKAVSSIGAGAFSGCYALSAFSVPEGIAEIKAHTFEQSGLKSILLPKNIQSIGEDAFAFCEELKSIEIYNNACTFARGENTTPDSATLYMVAAAENAIGYAQAFAKPYTVLCTGRSKSHATFNIQDITKASASKDGKITKKCSSCGYVITTGIAKIKAVMLTKTSFYFTGKKQYPSASQVQVTDSAGKLIPASNYTVSCRTDGKKVGKHSVKITFKASSKYYTGSFVRTYSIVLKGTAVKSATAGKGQLRVYWAKQTLGTNGYQVQLCKSKNFKSGVVKKTIRSVKTTNVLLKGLARKKGYYIRVRTFRSVGKNQYVYSAWSPLRGKKTK